MNDQSKFSTNSPHARVIQICQVSCDLSGDKPNAISLSAKQEILKWVRKRVGLLPQSAWDGRDFEAIDPIDSRHSQRRERMADAARQQTFKECAEDYMAFSRSTLGASIDQYPCGSA